MSFGKVGVLGRGIFNMILLAVLCGFDLSNATIPVEEIFNGGPPKDGIPALTDPTFETASEANYLDDGDRVIGVSINGQSKAYPLLILNWHEVVNDKIGGSAIVVTYCPLCGTGMVFNAVIDGARLEFGVSGKLYNSDVLLYDRRHESLWSQIGMKAISGDFVGTRLEHIAAENTTWNAWRKKHSNTKVLSLKTGYTRDYSRDPYADYAKTRKLMFPVKTQDSRLAPKDWVVGLILGDKARAYSLKALAKMRTDQLPVRDLLDGKEILVHYDPKSQSAQVTDVMGKQLASVQSYWFAWYAFYPETSLYSGG